MCTKGTGPHLQRTDGLELLSATIACSCEVSAPSVHRRWHASSRLILPAMMRGKLTCDSSPLRVVLFWSGTTQESKPPFSSELAGLGPMRRATIPRAHSQAILRSLVRSMRLETHDKSCRGNARAMQSLFVTRTHEAMRTGFGGRVRWTPKRSGWLRPVRSTGA